MRSSSNSRIPDFQAGNAGASPAGRTIIYFHHTAGVSLRSEVSKSLRVRGSTGTSCQFFPHQQRSSQVVRQRFHTPRIAGSNPASATIFNGPLGHSVGHPPCTRKSTVQSRGGPPFSEIAREGVSKPASFGARRHPGQHRGARPFFPILRSLIAEHPPYKRKTAARNRAEGPIHCDVKAACPSAKRDVVVQVHAGEPRLCS